MTNRAGMLWRLGDYDKAAQTLLDASQIADKPEGGYKAVLAAIYQYEGEMRLSQGRFAQAIEKSDKARSLADTKYPDVVIRAMRVMGVAQTLLGKREGKLLCSESLEMAKLTKDPRLISTSYLALAEASLTAGDPSSALVNALEAQKAFSQSDQFDSEWRAWFIASKAMRQVGDETKGNEYAERARNVFNKLEQKWGKNWYNAYRARPDVQSFQATFTQN